jgi:hypothetical protein
MIWGDNEKDIVDGHSGAGWLRSRASNKRLALRDGHAID